MKEKKSPSRTLFERKSDREIIDEYGHEGWLICLIKSLSRHDSDRHRRRRERERKHIRRGKN